MRASAMGMQHWWVPHLPPGTGSSAPHVLQGSHTLQSCCCMFPHHSRCTDTDHLRLPKIYTQSTTVVFLWYMHLFHDIYSHAPNPAVIPPQNHYKRPSKPTRLLHRPSLCFRRYDGLSGTLFMSANQVMNTS